jgi:hypothetical protein
MDSNLKRPLLFSFSSSPYIIDNLNKLSECLSRTVGTPISWDICFEIWLENRVIEIGGFRDFPQFFQIYICEIS